MRNDPLDGIKEWGQEIEYMHVVEAVNKARSMLHSHCVGLRLEDQKEITAYHTGINNLLIALQKSIKK